MGGGGSNDLGGRQRCEAEAVVASAGLGDGRERETKEVELAVVGGGGAASGGGGRRWPRQEAGGGGVGRARRWKRERERA